MRPEGQIRHQLKQVAFRHLQKRLRENFRQRPDTCLHNGAVLLDEVTGAAVGLCGLITPDGAPRNVPCDARIPGCTEMVRACSLWTPLQTKEEIKAEFSALLHSEDRGVIAAQYPDIAALLWVLDQAGVVPTDAEVNEVTDKVDEPPPPPHRWWTGVLKKLGAG